MKKFNLDNFFFGYIIFVFILGISVMFGGDFIGSLDLESFILEGLILHSMIFPFIYAIYTLFYTCGAGAKNSFKNKLAIIFNIIDTILCLVISVVYPIEIGIGFYIYIRYELYYYILCIIFSFMPLVSKFFYKKEVNKDIVKRIVTRVLMIIIVIYFCYVMNSCGAGLENFG